MKKIIIVFIIIIIAVGAYYFFYGNNNNKSNNVPASTSTNTPAATTVSIKNFSFVPSTLTIKSGTKITWINDDIVAHTVTSDSGNLLDSPALSPGQSFSFTFTSPGSVNYHCNIHKAMKGVIVVEN